MGAPMNNRFAALVRRACDEKSLFALMPDTTRLEAPDVLARPTNILFEETTARNFDHHCKYGTFMVPMAWLDLYDPHYHFFEIEDGSTQEMHFSPLARTEAFFHRYWDISCELDFIPHMFAGTVGFQTVVDDEGKQERKHLTLHVTRAIFFKEGDAVMGRALYDDMGKD